MSRLRFNSVAVEQQVTLVLTTCMECKDNHQHADQRRDIQLLPVRDISHNQLCNQYRLTFDQ